METIEVTELNLKKFVLFSFALHIYHKYSFSSFLVVTKLHIGPHFLQWADLRFFPYLRWITEILCYHEIKRYIDTLNPYRYR